MAKSISGSSTVPRLTVATDEVCCVEPSPENTTWVDQVLTMPLLLPTPLARLSLWNTFIPAAFTLRWPH